MKTIAITGEKRTGKSTLIKAIKEGLHDKSINIDGLLSLPVIENNQLIGFDLLQIKFNKIVPLARKGLVSTINTAKFGFYKDAFDSQFNIIQSNTKTSTVCLLDEIGILEMRDLGWHNLILDLKYANYRGAVIVIRKSSFNDILRKYNLKFDIVVDLDCTDVSLEMLVTRLINFIS